MGILPGILQNYNLLRFVRFRRPHRLGALPQIGGSAPPAGYDYLIKQPFVASTFGVILPVGAGGAFDSFWAAQHSMVLSSGTYYHYYHGSTDGSAFKIGVATSTDGITLIKSGSNPILTVGAGGTWDSHSVGNPIVWIEGATWHMLYGGDNSTVWGVGHATSSDGTTWTKDAANPVMVATGGAWDSLVLGVSSVLNINGLYWMYYWGSTTTGTPANYKIGLATAASPSGPWTKHPLNPLLVGETAGGVWDAGVLDPQVLMRDGFWFMLYQGNTSDGLHSAAGLAWSTDGLHWERDANNPRMTYRPNGSWFDSAWGGEVPNALQVGSDWYVYWNGSNGSSPQAQGGYALWLPFGSTLSALFSNLKAYYELNNSNQESSDNGLHGTNSNTSAGAAGSGPGGTDTAWTFSAASSSYVNRSSNAVFQIGSGDFCISVWWYPTSKAAGQAMVSRYLASAGNHEWAVLYNLAADRIRFLVTNSDGNTDDFFNDSVFGSPPLNTWTHILAWYDATAQTINLCINNGTVQSHSHTGGVNAKNINFDMGILDSGGGPQQGVTGRLAKVMIFKSATGGGAIPNSTQRTWLYNSGSGRTYRELPTAP